MYVCSRFIAVCTFLKYWVQLGMWKRAVNQLARRPDAMDQAFRIAYLETTGDEFEEAEARVSMFTRIMTTQPVWACMS